MEKISFKEKYPEFFHATDKAEIITTPKCSYISTSGTWYIRDNPAYERGINTLRAIAFLTRSSLRIANEPSFFDYHLPPFQAIRSNTEKPKEERKWKLYLLQPDYITKENIHESFLSVKVKNDTDGVKTPKISLTSLPSKMCIQILHTDDYESQKKSYNSLVKAAKKEGYVLNDEKREVYITDPRNIKRPTRLLILRYGLQKIK